MIEQRQPENSIWSGDGSSPSRSIGLDGLADVGEPPTRHQLQALQRQPENHIAELARSKKHHSPFSGCITP
ncbi:hypothetical protein GCWU000324_00113 [Kingella oralis ATCC 51147]|uniref:Uncharacterized protein n=1 Tax=Kingella oralis ATCC 51147 TaxID=629741 RepID=C4GEM6_9NEIS|nr:hypothetical protein GCWU000324_00113 [Kingella oralis ATCC 51147]